MQWIAAFATLNLITFAYALWQCAGRKNPFGRCPVWVVGSFVWGDAVIFSVFWLGLSIATLFWVQDLNFFLFTASIFFVVRGFGETVYWLNQQFSNLDRNPPHNFLIHKVFRGGAVWFVHQITWQVIMVVSIVSAAFFGTKWLG